MDVGGRAGPLLPGMFQPVPADEDEFVRADGLDRIPDDPDTALGMLDEIDLELPVLVDGIVELGFVPVHDIEAVLVGQWGDFMEDGTHNGCIFI